MSKLCAKCNSKVGIGLKLTPLYEAIEKGVPHIEAVSTDYFVQCSLCETEWCCLGCAIEDDAVSHADFNRHDRQENHKEPFIIECCRCTGKKRSWE